VGGRTVIRGLTQGQALQNPASRVTSDFNLKLHLNSTLLIFIAILNGGAEASRRLARYKPVVDGARQRGDGIAAGDGLKQWP
jgi:hypothetical protein